MSAVEVSARRMGTSDAARTVRAMIATALMMVPLWSLFTNHRWLVDACAAIAVIGVPAALLRLAYPARVWQTWVGLVLLVPWLTIRFAATHAFGGVLPGGGTWTDVSHMFDEVRTISNDGVAPVHATAAVTFVLALLGGLLAAFVDLIAVVGRRAAIAGVPILVVYTVVGAVTRHPVSWPLFVCAGAAFLVLLALDASDTARTWGQLVPARPGHRSTSALGVSGPRIAALALALAVVVPFFAPSRPSNLLANAFHSGDNGHGIGGFGAGGGVTLDPFASLKGFLERTKPTTLFTVTTDPSNGPTPYYLRANVLSDYNADGWFESGHGTEEPIESTQFATQPPESDAVQTDGFTVRITVAASGDNPPVLDRPQFVSGVDRSTTWSPSDEILVGSKVHRGDVLQEQIVQPRPTTEQLEAASAPPPDDLSRWLRTPRSLPGEVTGLVNRLVKGAATPFDRALALDNYFLNPANGFIYSLSAVAGDSGSALVDFLKNKQGFCQQFAGALGIMLRVAGIPSRVVLGYTHQPPDISGRFTITTTNAHAWVEAYLTGIGWIPFDPTPIAGTAGGATLNLPYASHAVTDTPTPGLSQLSVGARSASSASSSAPEAPQVAAGSGTSVPWGAIGVVAAVVLVLLLALLPAVVRLARRRRRLRAGRRGDPDPLWAELSDTARDLGYVWSPARSPRQVATWLGREAGGDREVTALALAVERARYAPTSPAATSLVGELEGIEQRLRSGRSGQVRLRARLFPASLGWRVPLPRRRR